MTDDKRAARDRYNVVITEKNGTHVGNKTFPTKPEAEAYAAEQRLRGYLANVITMSGE